MEVDADVLSVCVSERLKFFGFFFLLKVNDPQRCADT